MVKGSWQLRVHDEWLRVLGSWFKVNGSILTLTEIEAGGKEYLRTDG